ncbi:MAG: Hsp20/alpha crystallin family protein [Candidatus Altiarchaeota archaeon]|nr:Hsp20/alpha crystallin family protein [Candidatus Altiarchaeota archaeon]
MFRKRKDEGDEEDEPRRPKGYRDPFFDESIDDFFGGFHRIDEIMNELMKNMFSGKGEFTMGKPFVYGFSMKTGPDGKPEIREFGNVKPTGAPFGKPAITDAREPLVDVMDGEKEIIVMVELPGVSKEDINLEASETSLEVSVDNEKRKYHKVVELPAEVKEGEIDASYNNGVLEIRLKRKKEAKKVGGKKVQIK